MAQWTNGPADERHLSDISGQLPIAGRVRILLKDGRVFEGIIRGGSVGNNAGKGGWRYYGQCDVEGSNGQVMTVDYMDIQSASSVP